MDGKRVDLRFQLIRQRRVDHAVTFNPALPAERFRHNIKTKVRFTAGVVSGMPFMQMRFVFDVQAFRRESRRQFRRKSVLHAHELRLSGHGALRQWPVGVEILSVKS
jgi:hypothetical protein